MSSILQQVIDEEPIIDLTPFLDVIFLLLIFFMLWKFKCYEGKYSVELPFGEYIYANNVEDIKIVGIDVYQQSNKSDIGVHIEVKSEKALLFLIEVPRDKREKKQAFLQFSRMFLEILENKQPKIIEIQISPKTRFDYIALLIHSLRESLDFYESDLYRDIYHSRSQNNELYKTLEDKVIKITFKPLRGFVQEKIE